MLVRLLSTTPSSSSSPPFVCLCVCVYSRPSSVFCSSFSLWYPIHNLFWRCAYTTTRQYRHTKIVCHCFCFRSENQKKSHSEEKKWYDDDDGDDDKNDDADADVETATTKQTNSFQYPRLFPTAESNYISFRYSWSYAIHFLALACFVCVIIQHRNESNTFPIPNSNAHVPPTVSTLFGGRGRSGVIC